MKIFDWFKKQPQVEQRNSPEQELNLFKLDAGNVQVTENNVYNIIVAKACVELIADTLAGLSHAVYRKTPSGREKIDDHPVQLAFIEPNDLQTGFVFKQTLHTGPLINGNGYAYINRSRKEIELLLLNPRDTKPELKNGALVYETQVGNKRAILTPDQVLHIQGLGNGIRGISPIEQAKSQLAMAMNLVEYGKAFFENGATVGGYITTTRRFKDQEVAKTVVTNFNMRHKGAKQAFRIGLLEEGDTYTPTGIPPEQAQFLQTRQFTDKQIASQLFKVPLHMVGLEVSSSSSEQRGLEFLQFTMYPWLKRWEQEINRKLFTEAEKRQGYYFEFNVESLLRADITTRYGAYSIGRTNGWLNINEIRAKENMDSIGEQGDIYLTPLNMVNTDQINDEPGEEKPEEPSNEPTNNPNTLPSNLDNVDDKRAYRQLLEATTTKVLNREIGKVKGAIKRNFKDQQTPEDFRHFINGFYNEFESTVAETMKPVLEMCGADIDKFVADHIAESRKDLALALWADNPTEALETTIKAWGETRAVETTTKLIGG